MVLIDKTMKNIEEIFSLKAGNTKSNGNKKVNNFSQMFFINLVLLCMLRMCELLEFRSKNTIYRKYKFFTFRLF